MYVGQCSGVREMRAREEDDGESESESNERTRAEANQALAVGP